MRLMFSILALTLLLSFGGIFFLTILSFGHVHNHDEHGVSSATSDCPFMAHEEGLCPMTVLDHLTILKSVFEAVVPSVVSLALVAGVVLIAHFYTPKPKPLFRLHAHTFQRWRVFVTYCFSYRSYQEFFSQGILNPKLFC